MIIVLIGQKLLRILYRKPTLSFYRDIIRLKRELLVEILDIGGGPGHLLKALRSVGILPTYYIVVEVDTKLAEKGEIREYSEIVVADAHRLPLRIWHGTILFHDSLHHFSNPYRALEEATNILGGENSCIVVDDIDPSTLAGRIIKTIEKLLRFPATFIQLDKLVEFLSSRTLYIDIRKKKLSYIVTACRDRETNT